MNGLRWTEDQLAQHESRKPVAPQPHKAALYALGRLPAGTMNKTEARYAEHLEQRKRAGEIHMYMFEAVKFRLADSTFYTPDFLVMLSSGILECHEVKGHWEDDARVKIKVAASLYPFRFIAVRAKAKTDGGGWDVETFSRETEQ